MTATALCSVTQLANPLYSSAQWREWQSSSITWKLHTWYTLARASICSRAWKVISATTRCLSAVRPASRSRKTVQTTPRRFSRTYPVCSATTRCRLMFLRLPARLRTSAAMCRSVCPATTAHRRSNPRKRSLPRSTRTCRAPMARASFMYPKLTASYARGSRCRSPRRRKSVRKTVQSANISLNSCVMVTACS